MAAVAHWAPERVCKAQGMQVSRGKEGPYLSSQGSFTSCEKQCTLVLLIGLNTYMCTSGPSGGGVPR